MRSGTRRRWQQEEETEEEEERGAGGDSSRKREEQRGSGHSLTSHSVLPAGIWTVRKTWWSVTSRMIWPSETRTSRQP